MKKFIYFFSVLALVLCMSFTTYQYFTPMLKTADPTLQVSVLQDFWQFLLLGFVIGGVFFTIPGHNPRIHIAGSLSVIGSCIFLMCIGVGVAVVDSWLKYPIMAMIHIGTTCFYAGIAIVMIELLREVPKTIVKEIKNKDGGQ